jgi:two-component system response regulator AtoC
LSEKNNIELENLPIEILNFKEEFQLETLPDEEYSIKKASKALEVNLIRKALRKTKGNHTHAAKLLEISHRALLYKIKEYEIVENGL